MRVKFLETKMMNGIQYHKGMQYDPEQFSESLLENMKSDCVVKLVGVTPEPVDNPIFSEGIAEIVVPIKPKKRGR